MLGVLLVNKIEKSEKRSKGMNIRRSRTMSSSVRTNEIIKILMLKVEGSFNTFHINNFSRFSVQILITLV